MNHSKVKIILDSTISAAPKLRMLKGELNNATQIISYFMDIEKKSISKKDLLNKILSHYNIVENIQYTQTIEKYIDKFTSKGIKNNSFIEENHNDVIKYKKI